MRELTRQESAPNKVHVKAMHYAIEYCRATPNRGWKLKPNRIWDGKDKPFQKVSGYTAFLDGAPITIKSVMQKIVVLSVTEAETIAGVQCVQDIMYCMRILECVDLRVDLPMMLHIDNSRAINLANKWSAGGRTRHMETRLFSLRDIKEAEVIEIKSKKVTENPVDVCTKNLAGPAFNWCAKHFVAKDKYNTA
eukprot:15365141-Ditylum_brightwellii.AAC.1